LTSISRRDDAQRQLTNQYKLGVQREGDVILNHSGRVTLNDKPCDAESLHRVTQNHTIPSVEPSREPSEECINTFPHFWNLYPRKLDKQAAMAAWRKLKPSPELTSNILARLQSFIDVDWATTEPQFIPYPASWLNGARWEDEIPAVGVRLSPANAHLIQRIAQLREQEDEEVRNSRIANDDQRALAGTVNGRFDAQDVGRGVGIDTAQRGQGISAPAATNGHGAAISVRGLPRSV